MAYARVLRIPQYFRNLQRLSEIVRVLIKHGFGDLVTRLNLHSYVESGLRIIRPSLLIERPSSLAFGMRLRLVCEELGPTFIKFGQLVATRPDIFPDTITRELRRLQDRVPPFPVEQAREMIESELKCSLPSIFSEFSETPLAAASIAQVHLASLHTGAKVIVKVQRPNLDRIIESDVDILRGLATLMEEHFPESSILSPLQLVEELERTLRTECDFEREAHNMKRFAANFGEESELIVPRVYQEFSSRKVLTEQFIDGVKADDIERMCFLEIDRHKVSETLCRVVLKSIFEHRFFHADPHPGNIFITPDGKVALVDFGAMGRLDKSRVFFILHFLTAILNRNLDKLVRILMEHQFAPASIDEVALKNQVAEIIDLYLGQDLGHLDAARMLSDVFEVVRRYGIRPPADLLLVGKSLTTLEYIGANLWPDFHPLRSIGPYLASQYVQTIYDPRLYSEQARDVTDSYLKLIRDVPDDLRAFLRNVVRENLVFQLSSRDAPAMRSHQNRMINRVIMTVIGVALLALGVTMRTVQDSHIDISVSYALMMAGSALLFLVWIAVRRTGGTVG